MPAVEDSLARARHRHGGGRSGVPGRVARECRSGVAASRGAPATWVRGVSKGRLIAKTPGDLLESAALCRAMLEGEIERPTVPFELQPHSAASDRLCGDGTCGRPMLFDLVRSAYPFHSLSAESFESVCADLWTISDADRDLRARVVGMVIHTGAAPRCRHRAAARGRRHDSRHGSVSGSAWGRGAAAGGAGRGVRVRASRGRDIRPGQRELANRADRGPPRGGLARGRANGGDAILAGGKCCSVE